MGCTEALLHSNGYHVNTLHGLAQVYQRGYLARLKDKQTLYQALGPTNLKYMQPVYQLKVRSTVAMLLLVSLVTATPSQTWGIAQAKMSTYQATTPQQEDNQRSLDKPEKINTTSKLSKDARNKTRRLDPFKKEQSKELLRASTQMGLGILLIGGFGYLLGGTEAFSAATFMGPLISGMLVKPLGNIGNKLCTLFTPYLANPATRRLLDFKKRYSQRKHKLTKSMRVFMDTSLARYSNFLENWGYEAKELEKAIEEVLDFPLTPKLIDPALGPITAFIKNYPAEVRMAIGDFVVSAIADSKFEKLNKKAVPLMFVGAPGTGKTYLANQLGQLLGLPIEIVDIANYKAVNGTHFYSNSAEPGIIVDVLLGGKTKKGNFSNKILVIDEIDKALAKDENGRFIHESGAEVMSLLHTLLETQETTPRLVRYEGATHDISHLKIILVGNRTFSEVLGKENAAALETRVNLVQFSGFQPEQKLAIAREHIAKVCAARSIDYASVDQKIIEEIVQTDIKAGNQGVRVMLQVIDQYIRVLEKGTLISQVAGLPSINFDVKQAYAKERPE